VLYESRHKFNNGNDSNGLETEQCLRTDAGTDGTGNTGVPVELIELIMTWPRLPEAVKAGIVAMVKAAKATNME
jgi:hypothetical protein